MPEELQVLDLLDPVEAAVPTRKASMRRLISMRLSTLRASLRRCVIDGSSLRRSTYQR